MWCRTMDLRFKPGSSRARLCKGVAQHKRSDEEVVRLCQGVAQHKRFDGMVVRCCRLLLSFVAVVRLCQGVAQHKRRVEKGGA